jgi:hypothetical protein
MMATDDTKDVLEQILAQLYADQSNVSPTKKGAFLIAEDDQLLGNLNNNQYDQDSILNQYGPFGSQYSNTSIFNKYSPYGSEYGSYSINNPYCSTPPKLFLNGSLFAHISANQYVNNRISPKAFIYTIENNMAEAIAGNFIESEGDARQINGDSYIEAQDGVFLGKLTPNQFESDSIFNKFGPYGNKFSQSTFLNKFSNYGNQFSQLSANNVMANSPPKIYVKGKFSGYLTKNKVLSPRIDPNDLFEWAANNISKFG